MTMRRQGWFAGGTRWGLVRGFGVWLWIALVRFRGRLTALGGLRLVCALESVFASRPSGLLDLTHRPNRRSLAFSRSLWLI